MKLLALRARQLRRFNAGVAIENFADGVNLLAAANEAGKSTLFDALEAAFLLRHTSVSAAVERLRPRGGGEPLVEADFEAGGRRYRIRKQFGRGKSATLSDLDSGRDIARAQDAEDQLLALGAHGELPGRLGLMWVRQQRALIAPDPDGDGTKGKTRAETNALIALLSSEVVEAAGSGLAERIAERVRAELETYINPGRESPKKNGPYHKALEARDAARHALAQARDFAAASEARLARMAQLTAELASLEDPAVQARATHLIATHEQALQQAANERHRIALARSELEARAAEALAARQRAREAAEFAARRAVLQADLAAARVVKDEIRVASEAVNADGATPARLARLEHACELLARDEQALQAMSVSVEVVPETGAVAPIVADGEKILVPARWTIARVLTLSIPGAGIIRITPADAARAQKAAERCDFLRTEIADLYAKTGSGDLEGARARGEARQIAADKLDALRRAFLERAPRGIEMLESTLAEIDAKLEGLDPEALAAQARDADTAALAARGALETLKTEGVDEMRFKVLQEELEGYRRDAARKLQQARHVSEQLERLRGEQAAIDDEGRAGQAARCAEALELSEENVARMEAEIAALKVLQTHLRGAIEDVRTRYLEPVSQALQPYLTRVFPDAARVDFSEGFALQALRRAGESEEFVTLSDGTREQLAVLVRMGFARLFAERGGRVPLVLDDPLVYSDDARLEAMCDALNAAGRLHQVIVLTCRATAFSALHAHPLEFGTWPGS